jgi:hypothetical protein
VNENSSDPGQVPVEDPKQTLLTHPILDFSDADLAAMLKRVVRLTAVLGVVIALILCPVMGWQTGALFAVGAAISVGSVYEWARLIRTITARMDARAGQGQTGSGLGAGLVVFFFLVRLSLFAVAIYVSLKCFHGSPIALLCGLGLALAGLVWEAMRVLRG